MAWYHNHTRFDAIVTLRITNVANQDDSLKVGIQSAMKDQPFKVGIHDVLVGPGETIELSGGTDAEFLAARSCP